jgi:hypothetical protein
MTRNSRKKTSLSIKTYKSKKNQLGGSYGGPNPYAATSLFGNLSYQGTRSRESMAATKAHRTELGNAENFQSMIKDITMDPTVSALYNTLSIAQITIRENYISALKTATSITGFKDEFSKIKESFNRLNANNSKLKTFLRRPPDRSGGDKLTLTINSIRKQIIEDLYSRIQTEIGTLTILSNKTLMDN